LNSAVLLDLIDSSISLLLALSSTLLFYSLPICSSPSDSYPPSSPLLLTASASSSESSLGCASSLDDSSLLLCITGSLLILITLSAKLINPSCPLLLMCYCFFFSNLLDDSLDLLKSDDDDINDAIDFLSSTRFTSADIRLSSSTTTNVPPAYYYIYCVGGIGAAGVCLERNMSMTWSQEMYFN